MVLIKRDVYHKQWIMCTLVDCVLMGGDYYNGLGIGYQAGKQN